MVVGVIVAAALVVSCCVLLPLTLTVPAVPLLTYPALTAGVTLLLALTLAVIRPELLTLIVGFAVMLVAGVVTDPLATLLDAGEA